jgi:hypothetical protein
MRVIAHHERDDQDIELATQHIEDLQALININALILLGVVSVTFDDGWTYHLIKEE